MFSALTSVSGSCNSGAVWSLCILDPDTEGRGLQGLKSAEEDRSHHATGWWESEPPFVLRT